MTRRVSHMDCVAARAPAAAGRWLTHERIATSQPGGEIVCWTMIWSSHDPADSPEKSHLSLREFTKSKYLLKNTSKTYNLNILRSYNANWTHFWHLHLSIGIFCPNCLFLSVHPALIKLTAFLVLCTAKYDPTSLFLLFGAFFLLLLLLLVCWHLLLLLPNWLSSPFQLGLKHEIGVSMNQKKNEQECGYFIWGGKIRHLCLSCLFLLLAEKSFFPLPTPENHCLELLVVQLPIAVQVASLARRRREVQLFGRKRKKCSSFAISASVGGRSQLPPHHQCALQSPPPPLCSA